MNISNDELNAIFEVVNATYINATVIGSDPLVIKIYEPENLLNLGATIVWAIDNDDLVLELLKPEYVKKTQSGSKAFTIRYSSVYALDWDVTS